MRYLIAAVMTLGIGWVNLPTAMADDCDANQAAMNACADRDLASADADLNRQYQTQMAYLTTPARKLALKNAQIKWIAFRDADCLYQVGKPEDSGTIWPLLHAQCMAALTLQRVEQLKAYVSCREGGCPD
ncbi:MULTISPECIES: lysozyme inhibitor LprI family protein [unclassified Pseudomonas]|uniref:lysozyme inhibitor LprI family protein n=1 Tax=unclassified Pseudomonas TaxID=196821 RepID=UPI002AC97645|nr:MULTISPECIES: lysozyme inhibitor LprI family protein [unclassified Pseudomonas]MEB0042284.1 lysozyme inhibitor LprI family protein [Pseudomonas sp. MH10]MEB0077932.1 lysozyme inhibitor LprI family protein [Pseudomonas sp. MH10out]MEB0094065.1 lysozyme inhibitor LprI family protein [Pseudomonas sp. CCI4.2]MEB0101646.1 lysozyme inhibitor LprI family protein [Pseudomonas sp. CCI3.2]MEB0122649.1 lysozyme inhibitor LprI family protein [Pseudomonas sp. CCI1.2]